MNDEVPYIDVVENLFYRACKVLKLEGFSMRPMQRRMRITKSPSKRVNACTLAYIELGKKLITIDILTTVKRKPKSPNALLRILAHEFAHYQKPPYLQRYKGRRIIRQHYPAFYKQVNKNIEKFKKDDILKKYFLS